MAVNKVRDRKQISRQYSCHKILAEAVGVVNPVKFFFSSSHYANFGCCFLYREIACRRSQKWGTWPLRMWMTLRNTAIRRCVDIPNLVVLGQTVRAYVRRSAFLGHSVSLEPTRIDRIPVTYY